MCGIVGAVAQRNVVPFLLDGLARLEYRGYDSAGLAVINGSLHRLRSIGRVASLAQRAAEAGISGLVGIAHTRWATHGVPSERNAHPHVSGVVSVVHNGIIENHEALRDQLTARGYRFVSDTDTEVIAHLVHSHLAAGGLFAAVRRSLAQLEGAYAVAVIAADDPARLVVARAGAPLLIGLGDQENFVASDAAALLRRTRRVVQLDEGDCAEVTREGVRILDARGDRVTRPARESLLSAEEVDLQGYRHYMQKEIFEQPAAAARTLQALLPEAPGAVLGSEAARAALAQARSVRIVACGTSFHAGLIAGQWIEAQAGLPCSVEVASEYRYRDAVVDPEGLVVLVSQSGETADTLAAQRHALAQGHRRTLAVCNVPESAIVRGADLNLLTRAGPEIGVASTKAFTTQLVALKLLTIALARARGRMDEAGERDAHDELRRLPHALAGALRLEAALQPWAQALAASRHALYLGRGEQYPVAMEGALKLKEISYVHAEAYPAGELKHGPLALVDERMPVVALAPRDRTQAKLASNLEEVRARGGRLHVLGAPGGREGPEHIGVPGAEGALAPFVLSVPLQLLAYHAALLRGTDVDKPRNLAKSVTVE